MTTSLITNKFKEHISEQIIESIIEPANNVYYLLTGKHTPYTDDNIVPTIENTSFETEINVYEQGIFAKKITSSDIFLSIPRHNWTPGTVYSSYDPEDPLLFSKEFYAVVDGGATYFVYKVLDNNKGANSTVQPSDTSESACNFITLADGYTWKLMYKMPEATFEKFATSDYIPVQTSANVSGNTIAGALDVIKVTTPGSSYVSTLTGQFQVDDLRELIPGFAGNTSTYRLITSASANNDFYNTAALVITSGTGAGQIRNIIDYIAANRVVVVNSAFTVPPSSDSTYVIAPNVIVTGDGSGAAAYATVSSNNSVNNFISKVNIVNRGSNYSYAAAVVTGNTGGVSNSAILKPVMPPPGGHGKNAPDELGCDGFNISVNFTTNESGFITTENDYRKISIIRDPLIRGVELTVTDVSGTFTSNENILQFNQKPLTGTVSGNTTSTTLTGTGTKFSDAFIAGNKIIISDASTGVRCIRTIGGVSNNTSLALTSNLAFLTAFSSIAFCEVTALGVLDNDNNPFLELKSSEPKFITGKSVIGESSGALANVSAIDVGEKNYNNWNTLDNRTRISFSASSGAMPEDSTVFQTDVAISNASFHSANNTYVFLTSEKGPINADPLNQLTQQGGAANFTLGSIKYSPDIIKGTGKVLYIENISPISRSPSQSETIKLTIKF
jgi:hypothetical protein